MKARDYTSKSSNFDRRDMKKKSQSKNIFSKDKDIKDVFEIQNKLIGFRFEDFKST